MPVAVSLKHCTPPNRPRAGIVQPGSSNPWPPHPKLHGRPQPRRYCSRVLGCSIHLLSCAGAPSGAPACSSSGARSAATSRSANKAQHDRGASHCVACCGAVGVSPAASQGQSRISSADVSCCVADVLLMFRWDNLAKGPVCVC